MSAVADILVIGGGPAGAIAALRLQRLGYDVQLVERAPLGRSHVGEGVSAGVARQLAFLGLDDVLTEAGHLAFDHSETWWTSEGFERTPAPPGLATVDRARLDAHLLQRVASEGVQVRCGVRVRAAERRDAGWRVSLDAAEGPGELQARFLVDASGRASVLPSRREATGARTLALYGYWRGASAPAAPRIYAGPDHWAWGAPIAGPGYNVTLFTERGTVSQSSGGRRERYLDLLRRSAVLDLASDLELASEVIACDATGWIDRAAIGPGFIKVGEAAHSLDPLASMGLQKAIQTAIWAAAVVNTTLQRPRDATAAQAFYADRLQASAAQHAAWAAEIYGTHRRYVDQAFWQARRGLPAAPVDPPAAGPAPAQAPIRLAARARTLDAPCLIGDFVEVRRAVQARPDAEPVVFLAGIEIAPMLDRLVPGCTREALEGAIGEQVRPAVARRVVAWLLAREILQAA